MEVRTFAAEPDHVWREAATDRNLLDSSQRSVALTP
jgi:hypothetical protein